MQTLGVHLNILHIYVHDLMQMAAPSTSPAPEPEKSRKRPRAARACESCRAKKYRCDELYPCSQCRKLKSDCIYKGAENIQKRIRSSSYVAELERKVAQLSSKIPAKSSESPVGPSNLMSAESARVSDPLADYTTTLPAGCPNGGPAVNLRGPSDWKDQAQLPNPDEAETPSDSESIQETGGEVRDINHHTKGIEYHGNTSSMAFLSLLQTQNQGASETSSSNRHPDVHKPSLISTLHNVAFSPDSNMPSTSEAVTLNEEGYYFRQSRVFLDGYFENLHFIHPILQREEFLYRCEDLWFGRSERQPRSFVALYYSILSLGALVRVWDEDVLEGMNRFQWSRKLFNHARLALGELRSTNDLETVQCLIFMAKVCQNELNPHLAYMYLGMAVRASLSAGHHREPISKNKSQDPPDPSTNVSKTWWGLYSLEVEMSFSLGRPDSLGLDDYHNRRMPPIDDSEIAILPIMIPFARITRKVSVSIYLSKSSLRDKISMANQIEAEMDAWLTTLPEKIRPGLIREENGLRILKDPKWARRQRLVLQLRYLNVKMVLYRPFLVYTSQSPRRLPTVLETTVAKCVDAARSTIEVMHDTFCHHVFFRTWWYNTTYILYAASIVLCYATQAAPSLEKPALFRLVDMTVEILEAMDECVVAAKAVEMIKQTLAQAREHSATTQFASHQGLQPPPPVFQDTPPMTTDLSINAMLDSQMPSMYMDTIFDFDEAMDESQFLFWTDLNGALGGFGG